MKISIVIPTYEAHNRATEFLNALFHTIELQTYHNYEIIVMDHSLDDEIEKLCKQKTFLIQHFYNKRERGNSSVNMNEGIKKSSGDFIKIMHMDDMFCSNKALELMANEINSTGKKWGAFASNSLHENEGNKIRSRIPSMASIGCPSISFFVNDNNFFDENFIIMNDADIHFRLEKKYGQPIIILETCIIIRRHSNQLINLLGKKKEQEERIMFKKKCHG